MAEKNESGAADIKAKEKNAAPVKKVKKKDGAFKNFLRFIKSVVSEGKKVHWPTPKQLRNNTVIVIVMVVLVGAFVWGIDSLMALLTNFMVSG